MAALRRAYVLAVFGFLYGPIALMTAHSVNASRYGIGWKGFTLDWYRRLAQNRLLLEAAGNSVLVAMTAATAATGLGALVAVALHRYRFRGRKILGGLLLVVLVSPDIVMAISLLCLFVAAGLPLGFGTLFLAHVTFCLPFVAVTVYSRLQGFNPHLVEAALDLGAGEWLAFRRVVLPLAWPAVVAGWLLSLALSLDDVIVSFFVTGPSFEVLPLRIYSMVRLGVKPEVNALGTLLFAAPLTAVLLAHRFWNREEIDR
ncbi:spermidine/putrescine ABC transporter permease PotC [Deferrisoma sp.]